MSGSPSSREESWLCHPRVVSPCIVLLLTLAVFIQGERARQFAAPLTGTDDLYFQSAMLDRMALSFDSVLADIYWISTILHYGEIRRADDAAESYDLLYPLLDITTSLDPRFNIAYRFGAIFLAEAYPDGPGRPDLAVKLLEKGIRHMPDKWEYLMDIGFVHYWWLHDYEEATTWFQRAGNVPGAPSWLQPLAAHTLTQGGDREGARLVWQQIRDTESDAWLRRESSRRLGQLDALDDIDRYMIDAEVFSRQQGRWPRSWQEMVELELLSAAPRDPLGYPYSLRPSTQEVAVSPESPLWPLPTNTPSSSP